MKSKKGVSAIIGYVLLIGMVIGMSILIYQWVKTYIPQETIECPSEVSILVKGLNCIDGGATKSVDFKIKNNGLFNVNGYFVKVSYEEGGLATVNLKEDGGYVDVGTLEPGVETDYKQFKFHNPPDLDLGDKIYTLEITPIRFEETEEGEQYTVCGESKATENLNNIPNCN